MLLVHREGGPAVDLLHDVRLGARHAHLGGGGLETVADPDAPGTAAENMDGGRHVASGELRFSHVGCLELAFIARRATDDLVQRLRALDDGLHEPLAGAAQPVDQRDGGRTDEALLAARFRAAVKTFAEPARRFLRRGGHVPGSARNQRGISGHEQHRDAAVDQAELRELAGRGAANQLGAARNLARRPQASAERKRRRSEDQAE